MNAHRRVQQKGKERIKDMGDLKESNNSQVYKFYEVFFIGKLGLYQDKLKPKRERWRGAPPSSFGFYVLTRLATA
jgi:hypothetical protein